jgi:hypothetical protein
VGCHQRPGEDFVVLGSLVVYSYSELLVLDVRIELISTP